MSYSPLAGCSLFSLGEKGWDHMKEVAFSLKVNNDRYWSRLYDAIFHEENHQRWLRLIKFTKEFNEKH